MTARGTAARDTAARDTAARDTAARDTAARGIAGAVLKSKKYSDIDPAVVERISAETIPKYHKQKDIVKAVKKELHIIHESFLREDCPAKAEELIDGYPGEDMKGDKAFSAALMALHSSTNERLSQAAEIYGFIGRYVDADDNIIDAGCGFSPFALPYFSNLPQSYLALDISASTVRVLNKYFEAAGLSYRAEICDVAAQTPRSHGNVLFMFKLLPLLERRKKGRAHDLIGDLGCKTSIVSFPTKSVSGKEKGMEAFYSRLFENGLPTDHAIIEKMSFHNEMFYVLRKRNSM